MKQGEDKVLRVLDTYDNLINGKLINKRDISQKFNVSEKSIQRDIFEINNYLLTKGHDYDEIIKYDRCKKGYILKNKESNGLSRADLLVICKILLEVMYKDRFKEGEFLNKIQYMYTGELVKIQFKFRGRSLEAVLDRLPTANVITYDNEVPIIEAEVYWEGVKRWILSQQQYIEVIKPEEFRSEIKKNYRGNADKL